LNTQAHREQAHNSLCADLTMRDLDQLKEGAALRAPLVELKDTKENVRSALNRATRKSKRNVATATDGNFLYVWNLGKT